MALNNWEDALTIVPPEQRSVLTVSDIERMAKAGVKIEFENIKAQVRPDPVKDDIVFGQIDSYGFLRDFLRRWDRAQPNGDPNMYGLRQRALEAVRTFDHVSIFRHGAIFHVFVILTTGQIGHLTDPAEVFPSEALIAKVFLLQKEGKS